MKLIIAIAAASGAASIAAADIQAYWAFNSNDLPGGGFGFQPTDFPFGADNGAQAGSANITLNGGLLSDTIVNGNGDTVLQWVQSFAGSTVNAQFGEGSGGSLAVQGGDNNGNNGSWIEVAFDGTLLESTNFSFAGRRTGTGFSNITLSAFDGASFLGNLATGLDLTTSSTLALYSFDAGILDAVADARLRIFLDGATSTTGNVRLDNLLVEGTLIPTPGALAVLGLGGLIAGRRRR